MKAGRGSASRSVFALCCAACFVLVGSGDACAETAPAGAAQKASKPKVGTVEGLFSEWSGMSQGFLLEKLQAGVNEIRLQSKRGQAQVNLEGPLDEGAAALLLLVEKHGFEGGDLRPEEVRTLSWRVERDEMGSHLDN